MLLVSAFCVLFLCLIFSPKFKRSIFLTIRAKGPKIKENQKLKFYFKSCPGLNSFKKIPILILKHDKPFLNCISKTRYKHSSLVVHWLLVLRYYVSKSWWGRKCFLFNIMSTMLMFVGVNFWSCSFCHLDSVMWAFLDYFEIFKFYLFTLIFWWC